MLLAKMAFMKYLILFLEFNMLLASNLSCSKQNCLHNCSCSLVNNKCLIDCVGRNLSTITESIPSNTIELNLRGNNIQLEQLKSRLVNLTSLETLDLSYNNIKEIPNDIITMLPRLKTIMLSGNKISKMRINNISKSSIKYIYLTGNPIKCTCKLLMVNIKINGRCHKPFYLAGLKIKSLNNKIMKCNSCFMKQCPFKSPCVAINKVDYRCICPSPLTGKHCEKIINSNPCHMGKRFIQYGQKDNNRTEVECSCFKGYTGKYCKIVVLSSSKKHFMIPVIILVVMAICTCALVFCRWKCKRIQRLRRTTHAVSKI